MATTDEILKAAQELGKQIGETDVAKRFETVLKKLEQDRDAQRLLADQQRHMETLMQKEASGQPIEVADKHKLQELQRAVATNMVLGELQLAQMDYLDLMRQVDAAINGGNDAPAPEGATDGGAAAGGASPLVMP